MMKRFLLHASLCFPGVCCLQLFQCGHSLKGHCRCLQLPAMRHKVWISAIILNFHHTFCGAESIEIETTCLYTKACEDTLILKRSPCFAHLNFEPPSQHIYNVVAGHTFISCLYQGYSWIQRRAARSPRKTAADPLQTCFPLPASLQPAPGGQLYEDLRLPAH